MVLETLTKAADLGANSSVRSALAQTSRTRKQLEQFNEKVKGSRLKDLGTQLQMHERYAKLAEDAVGPVAKFVEEQRKRDQMIKGIAASVPVGLPRTEVRPLAPPVDLVQIEPPAAFTSELEGLFDEQREAREKENAARSAREEERLRLAQEEIFYLRVILRETQQNAQFQRVLLGISVLGTILTLVLK
jgi:hypothetical protein